MSSLQPPDDSHYLLAKRDLLAISYPGPGGGGWWHTWTLTLLLLTIRQKTMESK